MKKLKTILGAVALVLGLLWAAPSLADRVVPGYTLATITSAECTGISVARQSDGAGGFVRIVTATFEIKDETGVVREQVTVSKQLTTGESNALNGAINVLKDEANVAANL